MNTNTNQTETSALKSGIDYCASSFEVAGSQVTNSYKCNQRPFSSADLWSIQMKMRQATTHLTRNSL